MKTILPQLPKLHLACKTDALRYNLEHILIEGKFALATDAHLLIKYDLSEIVDSEVLEKMNGILIHKNVWKFLCTQKSVIHDFDTERSEIRYIGDVSGSVKVGLNEKWPVYGSLFDGLTQTPTTHIKVDLRLYDTLKRATGINIWIQGFNGNSRGIKMIPRDWNTLPSGTVALVMPVMISDDELKGLMNN